MAKEKKKHPKRGRRYSEAEKKAILAYACEQAVSSAVEKYRGTRGGGRRPGGCKRAPGP